MARASDLLSMREAPVTPSFLARAASSARVEP